MLRAIASTKKKVVISTGMSNLQEIKKAISFFPKKNVVLLHCISCYPTKKNDANLINIAYLKNRYKIKTGYSDHVPGITASLNATILGLGTLISESTVQPLSSLIDTLYKPTVKSLIS